MMAVQNGREPDDEEEDEEEEEDEPVTASPSPPARNHARQRARRSDAGISRPAKQSNWLNKEADLMWGEILQRLKETGHTPHEMKISVSINNPADGGLSQKLTEFEASSVDGSGDLSPSEALSRRVEDSVHLASGYPGQRQYQIRFLWKASSQIYGQGILNLPSAQQILAIRAQQAAETTDYSPMPEGLGRPPRQQQWQGPHYPSPYQQPWPPHAYGGPPPAGSVEMEQLRAELQREREQNARNQGMLEEIIRAQREGRAPNVPPPAPVAAATTGLGAVPPQAIDVATAIEAGIVKAVALLGGARMGRPQTQTSALEASLLKTTNEMVSGILHTALKQVSKGMERSVMGLGAPEEEEEPEAIVPPADPKEGLPFEAIELQQAWPDGSKVVFARSKATEDAIGMLGNMHPIGTLMGNPYVMAQSGAAIAGLASALTEAVKNVGKVGPHIVSKIPDAAQPAGLRGGTSGGWGE